MILASLIVQLKLSPSQDSHGTSSLHLAAMSGDTECVQLLLNLKPKPEQVFFVRDLPRKGRNKLEKKRTVKVSEK